MKLVIAGSRHLTVSTEMIQEIVDFYGLSGATLLIHGAASGIDSCGLAWAISANVPHQGFPAEWSKYGQSAGPKRNAVMAQEGDVLLLIWDGKSKGSYSMKMEMLKLKKPVYEVVLKSADEETRQKST